MLGRTVKSRVTQQVAHCREKSPLPLFSKEGLNFYRKNSPFEKGGQRGI
jgi:hypothetical protein